MARRALAICLLAAALATAGAAASPRSITKHKRATVYLRAGATRTLNVAYPDALKYGNARYAGSHTLAPERTARGSRPDLAKVAILEAQSVEGGSLYRVRAHNGNARGSAPVRLTVIATTIEPLPHR